MLDVVHVSKTYGRKRVLNDISFKVEPGSITAVIGENGSGKSTLMQIIIGIIDADEGAVRTTGRIGYCPQNLRLFPTLTVKENILYFESAYGLAKNGLITRAHKRREEFLLQFGLLTYLNQPLQQLSGGTQQKINLLISLLHDPDLCILDEPYGGFDWETYDHFWNVMRQLRADGKGILLVTHLLNDLKYFDRVLTLEKGNLV